MSVSILITLPKSSSSSWKGLSPKTTTTNPSLKRQFPGPRDLADPHTHHKGLATGAGFEDEAGSLLQKQN